MPMKAVYDTFDGEIVSETRNGVRKDYLPDPLGSTVALLDASHTKTESASYWPYGEQRGTGMLSTPLGFVGTLGYYTDDTNRVYVRARTLLAKRARWLTVDPLWPQESPYGYVNQGPITSADPSGLQEPITTTSGLIVAGVVGAVALLGYCAYQVAKEAPAITRELYPVMRRGLESLWKPRPLPTADPWSYPVYPMSREKTATKKKTTGKKRLCECNIKETGPTPPCGNIVSLGVVVEVVNNDWEAARRECQGLRINYAPTIGCSKGHIGCS